MLRLSASILSRHNPGLPAGTPPGPLAGNAVLLHYGHTPSLDYYWKGRFPDMPGVDTLKTRPGTKKFSADSQLVIVRHISREWIKYLSSNLSNYPGVIYFLDDDIPGILEDECLPPMYALKTFLRYKKIFSGLQRICSHVLVSTPALASKYGLPQECILEPVYLPAREEKNTPVLVFYHGTSAHIQEIKWLRKVLECISKRSRECMFEICGPRWVRDYYQNFSGVRVIHPMDWRGFFEYTSRLKGHIGLAPVLESRFNSMRSHVKYYDITRSGAAGIYSRVPQFERVIRHGYNGLLVDNDPRAWAEAILHLARHPELREQIHGNALKDATGKTHFCGQRSQ